MAGLTSPEVAASAATGLLLVPVGSTEQHGPHLPLATDTLIAVALAQRVAAAGRAGCLVAPALSYGASGEHAGFAGTLSIGTAATTQLLVELGRSATQTWPRLLFVSAHGGNTAALADATATLLGEGRRVRCWAPSWDGDAHAGYTETSLMLAIAPQSVRLSLAEAGNGEALPALMSRLRAHGVKAVSANGVLGDPRGATAEHGEQLLTAATAALIAFVDDWPLL
ncbi:MAG: mycofactocin biosynthesis peptidyl-dipeptidase MftE [Actinomycetota bacterium]|nr:MAG: mycofactocin biosynthesis peptidyl-dipeptidase MftE [Actinomycetota bacterium]